MHFFGLWGWGWRWAGGQTRSAAGAKMNTIVDVWRACKCMAVDRYLNTVKEVLEHSALSRAVDEVPVTSIKYNFKDGEFHVYTSQLDMVLFDEFSDDVNLKHAALFVGQSATTTQALLGVGGEDAAARLESDISHIMMESVLNRITYVPGRPVTEWIITRSGACLVKVATSAVEMFALLCVCHDYYAVNDTLTLDGFMGWVITELRNIDVTSTASVEQTGSVLDEVYIHIDTSRGHTRVNALNYLNMGHNRVYMLNFTPHEDNIGTSHLKQMLLESIADALSPQVLESWCGAVMVRMKDDLREAREENALLKACHEKYRVKMQLLSERLSKIKYNI